MYKIARSISPTIMQIFSFSKHFQDSIQKLCLQWQRSQDTFKILFRNSVYNEWHLVNILFGPKSLGACTRWPEKNYLIDQIQRKIKKWNPEHYPSRLCKTYIQHVGLINQTWTLFSTLLSGNLKIFCNFHTLNS